VLSDKLTKVKQTPSPPLATQKPPIPGIPPSHLITPKPRTKNKINKETRMVFPLPALPQTILFKKKIQYVLLKFRYISYLYFITVLCIILLSLCFSSTCTPLTLLQLRYILWCFIVSFRIIFGDLTCAFLSGVQDFMHLLCTIIGHDIPNIHITPS